MATPVSIDFNVTGTQATIAQIEQVTTAYMAAARAALDSQRMFQGQMQSQEQVFNQLRSRSQETVEAVTGNFHEMKEGAEKFGNKIQSLSFQLFMWQMTFQQLQGMAQGFYAIALKGNEELNQSIISTQSSLVAVTNVYKNGIKIEDPTAAIQALTPAIKKAIEDIRLDSLDLVGVTSDQLIPVFQILANNAGKITDQSKQWSDPIEAAQKLTISFAASLGTMGIPIRQARQEIQSMLQGYIDQNSILAQQLGIKNDQIRLWQKEGVLVDELMKRMEPFVAGNKLALQTINGMIPNIKEAIDEIIRVGTEPIYEPIVKQLEEVYKWLTKNKNELVQGTISFVEFITGLASKVEETFQSALGLMQSFSDGLGSIGEKMGKLPGDLGAIGNIGEMLGESGLMDFGEQIGNFVESLGTLSAESIQGFVDSLPGIVNFLTALSTLLSPVVGMINGVITVLNNLNITWAVGWVGGIAIAVMAVTSLLGAGAGLIAFLLDLGFVLTMAIAGVGGFSGAAKALLGVLGASGLKDAFQKVSNAVQIFKMGLDEAKISLVALGQATVIIGALMAAAWVWTEGFKLQGVNEGFDKELAKSNKAYTEAMNLRSQLQKAQKDAMNDGVVTEDEQKGLDKITNEMRAKKEIIKKSIADQRALLANANDDQKEGISASIAQLTKDLASIDPDDTALKMKGIQSLGDAYQKLGNDAAQGLKLLRENQFTENSQSEKAAKEVIANTKQQIELGLISVEEARKRYKELSQITYLDAATRIAAEKEMTALIKLEGDQQMAILSAKREKRLIGDEEFYQKSKAIQIKTIDDQIAAEEERMMGREKGESYYAKIAELETKKAKIINEAEQRLLQQRVLQIKVSTDTLKLEIEKANTVLTSVEQGLGTENKALEIGNKAIAAKKSLMESLIAVEKSYQDLAAAGQQIELSRAERSLAYYQKLQDVKIKGTALESAYQRELDKLGGYAKTEFQLLQAKQEAETKIFNAKLANLLKEQEMQRQLLDLDLEREQSQLRQNLNQEKINLLKAQQSQNEARGRILESQSTQEQIYLKQQDAIAQGKPEGEIEQLELQFKQEQNKLRTAYQTLRFSNDSVTLSEQSLNLAEESYVRANQIAQNRRTILKNQQDIARSQVSDEGNKLESKQNIEKAELFTNKEGMFNDQATQLFNIQQGTAEKNKELRLIGERDYARQSNAIAIDKLDEQISQTRERLNRLAANDKLGRDTLLEQITKFETQKAKLINESEALTNKAVLEKYDQRLTVSKSNQEKQLIGERDFARQSNAIAIGKLDEQINQAKYHLSRLAQTDQSGREQLNAQIANLEGQKAKLIKDGELLTNKSVLEQYDQRLAMLNKDREQRLIGEDEFYQRSKELNVAKYDEQISQTKERIDRLAKIDTEGRNALIAQIAELEAKKAKVINDADQSILAKRIQTVKISNELLKIETAKTGQVLTQLQTGLGGENSRLDLDNKALAARKTLLESLISVQKSYQELVSTGQQVELSRADRALDYQKRLQDIKIRGTALEQVYQRELDRLGDRGKTEFQLLQEKQEVEAKIYNTKLENALKEQAIQKELLEIDIQREQAQLRQAANQEKINLLSAMQASNEAMTKAGSAQSGLMTADLALRNALSQGLSPEQIASLQAAKEQAQVDLKSAQDNFILSQQKIALSQQSLQMVEENLVRSEQITANRRQILSTQQAVKRAELYEEGEKVGAGQRIQQADLLTNRIDQYRIKPPWWERQPLSYEKGTAYDIRTPTIRNRELIGDLPSSDTLRNLSPQSNNQVLPNQLNQIIDLMGQLKGGLGAIASTKTPVNPTINNNFNGPIDDTATMAKYRKQTLEIIDNVIPKP